jgi:SAM-dependent methyltransferase
MEWGPPPPRRPGVPADSDFPVALETPHHQAWGIPSSSDLDSLPVRMTDAQLQSMVLAVWKEMMLHDEVLAAASFLRHAPYRVRHTYQTEKALSMTLGSIAWMGTASGSDAVNTPTDPNGIPVSREIANPMPEPLTGQVAGREHWIRSRLPAGARIVDFGCIDGTMTNRWGLAGFDVTGVDMSQSSVAIANAKAAEFSTSAHHVCAFFSEAPHLLPSHSFDVFTCSDTYEHVVDPVQDLLVPAKSLLRGGGKALLVTPHGSWFRGLFVPWGHPWSWCADGHSWLAEKPRGHLVAPSVWSVSSDLEKAGFWVKDCSVVLQVGGDVPGQGNVCAEALLPPPPIWPGKSFSFLGLEFLGLAKEVASLGHSVTLYCPCPDFTERVEGFVRIVDSSKASLMKCDVLVTHGDVPPGSRARHAAPPSSPAELVRLATR